jgi:hypothetical protein
MVTVSFLEVYNEEIKDLLNPSDKKMNIREDKARGIFVEGLAELVVKDSKELLRLIYQGNAVRRVAATNMNDQVRTFIYFLLWLLLLFLFCFALRFALLSVLLCFLFCFALLSVLLCFLFCFALLSHSTNATLH